MNIFDVVVVVGGGDVVVVVVVIVHILHCLIHFCKIMTRINIYYGNISAKIFISECLQSWVVFADTGCP